MHLKAAAATATATQRPLLPLPSHGEGEEGEEVICGFQGQHLKTHPQGYKKGAFRRDTGNPSLFLVEEKERLILGRSARHLALL